jgi:5-methylcytosine-specific restriction protein A
MRLLPQFGLTLAERQQLRADGRDEPLWNNMIQWARRKLKDAGYLLVTKRGVWQLSPAGVAFAASKC